VSIVVPRFDFRIDCGFASDVGRARENNEDAYLVAPELGLFAVCDGMGGHAAGEVAARLALEALREAVASERSQKVMEAYVSRPDLGTRRKVFTRMRRTVERANERVRASAAEDRARAGMGTTLDSVWLARDHAFVAHVGDGRVYLARPRAMVQLTHDHAESASLKATGHARPRQRVHRDQLLNALGVSDNIPVDALFVDLNRGDRILVCTDGVHGQVGGEGVMADLLREGDPQQAADALVERARERGGRDNATAIVIEIGDRFVKREDSDRGVSAEDLENARQTALLADLPLPLVLAALSAAVEIELQPNELVPRLVVSDLVSYIVLDGVVRCSPERRVTTGAVLFPESLGGAWGDEDLPVVEQTARLLRMRADDFAEVCEDPKLGAELYRRLAGHLARLVVRSGGRRKTPPPGTLPPAV
jgi:serine/threonine protein phosphatase PrpC